MSAWEELIDVVTQRKPLVILAGAGVSAASGIPLAAGIVHRLQETYGSHTPLGQIDASAPGAYSHAMELAFPGAAHAADRRVFLDQLLNRKTPAESHHRIAQLARAGVVRYILTTNFDQLLEVALFLHTDGPVHVHIYGDTLHPDQLVPDAVHVIKLHGDLLFEDLGNLELEMDGRVDAVMSEAVSNLLKGSALLTLGQSCQDTNIRHLLQNVASSTEGMSAGFFFAAYHSADGNTDVVQDIARRMRQAGKPGGTIVGADLGVTDELGADLLLNALMERVHLSRQDHAPFGLGARQLTAPRRTAPSRQLSIDQRLPTLVVENYHAVPLPIRRVSPSIRTTGYHSRKLLELLGSNDLVVYVDDDSLRRKLVLRAALDGVGDRGAYFSARLALEPARSTVWNHLQHFTARRLGTAHRRADADQFFSIPHGVVMIWDDLDLRRPISHGGYDGALRRLIAVAGAPNRTGNGHFQLILATSKRPSDADMEKVLRSSIGLSRDTPRWALLRARSGRRNVQRRVSRAAGQLGDDGHLIHASLHIRNCHRRSVLASVLGDVELGILVNSGLAALVGDRVLTLVDDPGEVMSMQARLAQLAFRLKDLCTERTPYDGRLLLEAYSLFVAVGEWKEACAVLRLLWPTVATAVGSDFTDMVMEWWGVHAGDAEPPGMKLNDADRLWLLGVTRDIDRLSAQQSAAAIGLHFSEDVEVITPLRGQLDAIAQNLEPHSKLVWRATSSRNLEEVAAIAAALRRSNCPDLLAQVLTHAATVIIDPRHLKNVPAEHHVRIFSGWIQELSAICAELEQIGAADHLFLMQDNLANLYQAVGETGRATEIRDRLLRERRMATLTAHRAKLLGNRMIEELGRGDYRRAESLFVLSGISAVLARDDKTLRDNLRFVRAYSSDPSLALAAEEELGR